MTQNCKALIFPSGPFLQRYWSAKGPHATPSLLDSLCHSNTGSTKDMLWTMKLHYTIDPVPIGVPSRRIVNFTGPQVPALAICSAATPKARTANLYVRDSGAFAFTCFSVLVLSSQPLPLVCRRLCHSVRQQILNRNNHPLHWAWRISEALGMKFSRMRVFLKLRNSSRGGAKQKKDSPRCQLLAFWPRL